MYLRSTLMGRMSQKGCLVSLANCIGSCMLLWCPGSSHQEECGASRAKTSWGVHRFWLPAVWVETSSSQALWKWCSIGELEPIFNGLRAKTHRSQNEGWKTCVTFLGSLYALACNEHCLKLDLNNCYWHVHSGSHTMFAATISRCLQPIFERDLRDIWKIFERYLRDIWEIFGKRPLELESRWAK